MDRCIAFPAGLRRGRLASADAKPIIGHKINQFTQKWWDHPRQARGAPGGASEVTDGQGRATAAQHCGATAVRASALSPLSPGTASRAVRTLGVDLDQPAARVLS